MAPVLVANPSNGVGVKFLRFLSPILVLYISRSRASNEDPLRSGDMFLEFTLRPTWTPAPVVPTVGV